MSLLTLKIEDIPTDFRYAFDEDAEALASASFDNITPRVNGVLVQTCNLKEIVPLILSGNKEDYDKVDNLIGIIYAQHNYHQNRDDDWDEEDEEYAGAYPQPYSIIPVPPILSYTQSVSDIYLELVQGILDVKDKQQDIPDIF